MRILTAIDQSEYAEIVLEHGFDEAVRRGAGILHFITTVDQDDKLEEARMWLTSVVREGLETFGIVDRLVTVHVVCGEPVAQIALLAAQIRPELLVVGRFASPSHSDALIDLVECPLLIVGIDGPVLDPQCPACTAIRATSDGEQLFCPKHSSDRMLDLASRLPLHSMTGSRMW
jgi:nucleotide-binding universal stress UspA family protein